MLIRDVGLGFGDALTRVRVRDGRIDAIGARLQATPGERVVDGRGAALLPGLHDHHLHLRALAASLHSLRCGPPEVAHAEALAARLRTAPGSDGEWLRGVGYHECVAGDIDRVWLDRQVTRRPLRIQHRSGRLWILNSAALERLGALPPDAPPERIAGRLTGRIYDADRWLSSRIGRSHCSLAALSRRLAARGVTGVTDATPDNGADEARAYAECQSRGELLQRLCLMGGPALEHAAHDAMLQVGATKLHLHEHALPDFDALCAVVAHSHRCDRPVAAHCTTLAELVYFVDALRRAGPARGDRIEHASIVPAPWLALLRELGVTVVTQPNFIRERGDQYARDLAPTAMSELYRAQSFLAHGIALAAGTDAPFGDDNPWLAMQAATQRRTASGMVIAADEALTPEKACKLFLGPPHDPGKPCAEPRVGTPADLCLLDRAWRRARGALAATRVRMTWRAGVVIWDADVGAAGSRLQPRPQALEHECGFEAEGTHHENHREARVV